MEEDDSTAKLQHNFEQATMTDEQLDLKYPDRPRNHSPSLPFSELHSSLFGPLSETKKRPGAAGPPRKRVGPHGAKTLSPQEMKRTIVRSFISKWRQQVGNDIYPAFRLIMPDKDKERAMYGLKEKTIAKLIVRIVKIDKNAEDAQNLLNWKLPGFRASSTLAGDFAGRCYEVLQKRAIRSQPSDMTVDEVNEKLNELSVAQKEDGQISVMEYFYRKMNALEMMWLIRIILRQMKIGATEKTFFDLWHPDADMLFNISSNLRRVCWELADPDIKLSGDETDITLMQCFQPQLAQFQTQSFEKMVQRMRPTEHDSEFWIEEKLDGERMQLHMLEDDSVAGGKRFAFWSRKAKEYTYLYGESLEDQSRALTKYLGNAFDQNVRNIILDGEMITWNPETSTIEPFGTLKTAALNERDDPYGSKTRPLYRIFDILYLNDQPLTKFTLRDRRKALETAVNPVPLRFELIKYSIGHTAADIEPHLREVVAEAFEGLVLKNPRSAYRLNDRNDDWMKVKPEYMTGFGEELDCVIIGGYYGSGRRGGNLSSFLCGVRAPQSSSDGSNRSELFLSCFKVGGGFAAADYAAVRHHTDGKWHEWDRNKPPSDYVRLAGGRLQYEQPDAWIRPSESVVITVKAASITKTSQFAAGYTLRFPRFKRVRPDRNWSSALSFQEFEDLRNQRDKEEQDKRFNFEQKRKYAPSKRQKREMVVAGAMKAEELDKLVPGEVDAGKDLFKGVTFFVLSDSIHAPKKTKHEIEAFVKAHGASVTNTLNSKGSKDKNRKTICIADRNVVKVSSLIKSGTNSIVRPRWVFDCIEQAKRDIAQGREAMLLPWEPRHVLYVSDADKTAVGDTADAWMDGYACDIMSIQDMRHLLDGMSLKLELEADVGSIRSHIFDESLTSDPHSSRMFAKCVCWFDNDHDQSKVSLSNGGRKESVHQKPSLDVILASTLLRFAGGHSVSDSHDETVTHFIVPSGSRSINQLRRVVQSRSRIPHFVTVEWIQESWSARTLLDEERFSAG